MAIPQRDLKGLALSVVFVLILYWQAVSGQGAFFQRDIWLYWIPHIEWAARTLAAGHLPEWNPFTGFGAPFIADPSFQFFYPPSLLNWILQPKAAYTALVVGHSILGSLGAFQLLRRRLRSRGAALVGALVFVAAGPIVSSASLWHHFSSAMYMPWVLDAFLRMRAGRGRVERLGFLTGMQALAGSADVCVMTGVGLALLLPPRSNRLRRLLPRLSAAVLLCGLIAAVQWLPTSILAGKASRSALDPQGRLHWSVSPSSLIDFVLPLSGAAHASLGESNFLEERLRLVPWMYLGASTLPLILLGARRAPRAALVLLVAILLGLGRHTPLGELASRLPVISTFRFPSKVLWFVSGCWALLAAIGFQQLARPRTGINRPGILSGLVMLAIGFGAIVLGVEPQGDHEDWRKARAALPLAPLALGGVLVCASYGRRGISTVPLIVAADLVFMGQTYNTYASDEMLRTRPTIVDELHRQGAYRVYVFQTSRSESRSWKSPDRWSDEEAYYFGEAQFLLPPQSMRWSIKGSYDGDFTGLFPPDYSAMCAAASRGPTMNAGLLRLAGVTHAIRFEGPAAAEFPVVARVPTFHDRPALILRVPDPLPPAYVVERIRIESSPEAAIAALQDPGFDSKRQIVRVNRGPAAPAAPPGASSIDSTARVEYESDGHVVVQARLKAPGTLVVSNAFSDGWHARVDGRPQPVQKANLLFQSVDLDAGDHRVELDYETPGLFVGLGLSALGWTWMALRLSGPRTRVKKA